MLTTYDRADSWTRTRIVELVEYLERLRRQVLNHRAVLQFGTPERDAAAELTDVLFDAIDALDPNCLLPVHLDSPATPLGRPDESATPQPALPSPPSTA